MLTINDIFKGSPDEILEEVIILPVGVYTSGTHTIPSSDSWADFESVEFVLGDSSDPSRMDSSYTLPKNVLQAFPTNWVCSPRNNYDATEVSILIKAASATSFTISDSKSNFSVKTVIGYKKRYATRNLSKTLNVNGGNPISVNQRYEIDILAELGPEYVGRDLIVQAEIYNNSGQGVAGWAATEWTYSLTSVSASDGCSAFTLEDKIVVQTGINGLTHTSHLAGNPFGIAGARITAAPCRVKVWKIDQFISNTVSSDSYAELQSRLDAQEKTIQATNVMLAKATAMLNRLATTTKD